MSDSVAMLAQLFWPLLVVLAVVEVAAVVKFARRFPALASSLGVLVAVGGGLAVSGLVA